MGPLHSNSNVISQDYNPTPPDEDCLPLDFLVEEVILNTPPASSTGGGPANSSLNSAKLLNQVKATASLLSKLLDQKILADYQDEIVSVLSEKVACQKDARTNRITREFGYSFFDMERGGRSFKPIPEFLQKLGQIICKELNHSPKTFTNVIVSQYKPGFYLEPHVDVDKESSGKLGFYFSEEVYGFIIEADETGQLYFIKHDDNHRLPSLEAPPVFVLNEKVGTVFCLQGKLRHAPFNHGVSKVKKQRISITFREVIFKP